LYRRDVGYIGSNVYLKRAASASSWEDEDGLAERIGELWEAVQSGRYRALPTRRVYIRQGGRQQRPLGIAALEDKIVQQAVVTVLTPICEADFLGFSYGFRHASIVTAHHGMSPNISNPLEIEHSCSLPVGEV